MNARPFAKRWYALEIVPAKLESAMMFASCEPGYETMVPVEPRLKLVDAAIMGQPKLRWAPWIFITWPEKAKYVWLFAEDGLRAGIVRVMADGSGVARPVPDRVIQSLRKWRPSKPMIEQPQLPNFKNGEIVRAYVVPGHGQSGVFMGYETGNDARSGTLAKVKIWFMGKEHEELFPIGAIEAMPTEQSPKIGRQKSSTRDDARQYADAPLHPFK